MKKAAKIVFFLMLALVLGYYAHARYQHTKSLKGVVHQDADAILKIGLQDIKEQLLLDALAAPSYYLKNSKKSDDPKKEDSISSNDKGVKIVPHNLVLFSLPDIKNSWFTTLNITDKEAFEDYLQEEMQQKLTFLQEGKSYKTAKHSSGKFLLGWNSEKLILAGGLQLQFETISNVFDELLLENRFISTTDHPLLKVSKETKGHLVYADSSGATTINFEDGTAVIAGMHVTTKFLPSEVVVPDVANSALVLHYHDQLQNRKQALADRFRTTPFLHKNKISIDSILKPLNGTFSLMLHGKTKQKDTIITYGYDDNFEKVEQRILTENTVPNITIDLGVNSFGLLQYLDSAQVLTPQAIFKPFPLYQFQVNEYADHVVLSTKHEKSNFNMNRSSYFFQAQADFQRLQDDLGIPQTKPLFTLLQEMKIHAWAGDNDAIMIEGNIKAKEDDINFLAQLFFGLQNQKEEEVKEAEL